MPTLTYPQPTAPPIGPARSANPVPGFPVPQAPSGPLAPAPAPAPAPRPSPIPAPSRSPIPAPLGRSGGRVGGGAFRPALARAASRAAGGGLLRGALRLAGPIGTALGLAWAAKDLWDAFNEPQAPPAGINQDGGSPPFTGGQCVGQMYQVRSVLTTSTRTYSQRNLGSFAGPISGTQVSIDKISTPGYWIYSWALRFGAGQLFNFESIGAGIGEVPTVSLSVSPVSGADNCGDPPNSPGPPIGPGGIGGGSPGNQAPAPAGPPGPQGPPGPREQGPAGAPGADGQPGADGDPAPGPAPGPAPSPGPSPGPQPPGPSPAPNPAPPPGPDPDPEEPPPDDCDPCAAIEAAKKAILDKVKGVKDDTENIKNVKLKEVSVSIPVVACTSKKEGNKTVWSPTRSNLSIRVLDTVSQGFIRQAEVTARLAELTCLARNDNPLYLIELIGKAVGAGTEFPYVKPDLLGGPDLTVNNLAEQIDWVVRLLDGYFGQWPNQITTLDRDGKEQKTVIEDVAQWCRESFALGKVIAEDSNQALALGSRIAIQTINATTAASQAADIARATADFLGFAGQVVEREIEIPFSTPALGQDGTLQNQEVDAFLVNSKQKYPGFENKEKTDLLSLCLIISESAQYAKLANFFPLARGIGSLPGEAAKKANKSAKTFDEMVKTLESEGAKVVRKKRRGFDNSKVGS